ncbi:malonyl-CoA decarboxylase domain-containing protein [Natronocella acetinitrilica]|uniref:malonyl-CoA decarboxylase domain-containing protein n=1 Tax=Natronocella acetinitrilica TaxID=414046 RepID=UPI0034505ACC
MRDHLRLINYGAIGFSNDHGNKRRGTVADPVGRFHLGNGARLEQINPFADSSDTRVRDSVGRRRTSAGTGPLRKAEG